MALLLERSQVGKREDLADFLAIADMKNTPLISQAAKGSKLCNSLFEWVAEGYRNPTVAAHVDGDDLVIGDHNNHSDSRKLLQSRVHFFLEPFGVSYLAQDLSDPAGVGKKKEFAHNAAKALTVIKRAMEAVACGDNESQADNGTVGHEMRSLGKYIQNGAQSDLPIDASFRTPADQIYSGTWTNFVADPETKLNNILEARYNATGETPVLTCLAGSQLRRQFSLMANYDPGVTTTKASLRTFNQDANGKKIVNTIDIYQGDFGTVEIMPTVWNAYDSGDADTQQRRGYILDMEGIELRYNQMPEMVELEDKGGGQRGFWRTVAGLCVKNPLQQAKIAVSGS